MPTFTPSNWNLGSFFFSISFSTACATSSAVRRLRRGLIRLRFEHLLRLFQSVHFAAQGRVLIGEVLQHPGDVVQLVQTLQHFAAAIRHAACRFRLLDGADRLAHPGRTHGAALIVHDGHYYAPVHPARFIGLAIRLLAGIFRVDFAAGRDLDLAGAGSVLHQEVAHSTRAGHAQFVVVLAAAHQVRVAFDSNLVAWDSFAEAPRVAAGSEIHRRARTN